MQYANNLYSRILDHIKKFELSAAIAEIIKLADSANVYIDEKAPWALKKTDIKKMEYHLCVLLEIIRYIAILLLPFIPDSANKMLDQLNISPDERNFSYLSKEYSIKPRTIIEEPKPIFRKLGK